MSPSVIYSIDMLCRFHETLLSIDYIQTPLNFLQYIQAKFNQPEAVFIQRKIVRGNRPT